MAYTIIQAERKTGVPSTRIRFWIKKGLFPMLETDKNGVRYFSERDINWLIWVECFRSTRMSLTNIKRYAKLYAQGDATFKERKAILCEQRELILKDIETQKEILKKIEYKLRVYYDDDELNSKTTSKK